MEDVGGFNDPSTNTVAVSATISGLTWAPGDSLFIRWNDFNDAGNDAGVAIDNLSMIATVPEPSCCFAGSAWALPPWLSCAARPANSSRARAAVRPVRIGDGPW